MFFYKSILFAGFFLLLTVQTHAAPQAELWPNWQVNAPESVTLINHSAWAGFLQKYLVVAKGEGPNLVRYAAVSVEDQQLLADYLTKLSSLSVSQLNRAEQKAYWINLYNALTVKTVLDHYPIETIRDIKSGWFSAAPGI